METETPPSNDDGSCAAAAEVPSARPLRTGLATVALLASYVAIAIYAIHVELPPDPLSLPLEPQVRDIVQSVLPEGWNFFTRNPRESRLYALAPDRNGQWSSAMKGPNAEPANMFGGNRMARAQGVELGLLVRQVPASGWAACSQEPSLCIAASRAVGPAQNRVPGPTLCGDLGLVQASSGRMSMDLLEAF
jgi:antimicrobial peptide system SdpA family protein